MWYPLTPCVARCKISLIFNQQKTDHAPNKALDCCITALLQHLLQHLQGMTCWSSCRPFCQVLHHRATYADCPSHPLQKIQPSDKYLCNSLAEQGANGGTAAQVLHTQAVFNAHDVSDNPAALACNHTPGLSGSAALAHTRSLRVIIRLGTAPCAAPIRCMHAHSSACSHQGLPTDCNVCNC